MQHKTWNTITTEKEVLDIVERSKAFPQIIFKDSIRCGTSAFAKERLALAGDTISDKADFHYLDLITYRSVSNFIASELNVYHQSPQVIVLKNGQVTYSVTHHAIEAQELVKHL